MNKTLQNNSLFSKTFMRDWVRRDLAQTLKTLPQKPLSLSEAYGIDVHILESKSSLDKHCIFQR